MGKSPFGPKPMHAFCPVCKKNVKTRVTTREACALATSDTTLCVFGCFPFWPLCLAKLKTTYHSCPDCGNYVGLHRDF